MGWPPVEQLAGARFDVVHSSHPLLLPARHAAQVITIHDLHFLAHPEEARAEIRRDYPALVRRHAHRAARILVPSRFTALEVERLLGIPPERIALCPPGAPEWEPRRTTPSNGYVLFFSTLTARKNVGGLLDAYERLIALRQSVPELVLAGKADEDARPWLERINRPPLAGHVRHIGYVDPADRPSLYGGARLLVMPSFEEGFGIPVLEAMTFGVPVVASSSGALPEVLGDAGPLVNPDEPDEIAGAVGRLLDDDAYASACAAKGVLRARRFNWGETARLVYGVYQEAADDHQPGGTARPH
jgi:glycosyltransferase involved in cell wall biosynthesis